MNVILSIHPKWAKLIYEGKKTVEWRKNQPLYSKFEFHWIDNVFLYETAPVRKVTGLIKLSAIRKMDVRKWFQHDNECLELMEKGCVPVEDLLKYQADKDALYAWMISATKCFVTPKDIADFGLKRAPQSWCYTEVK